MSARLSTRIVSFFAGFACFCLAACGSGGEESASAECEAANVVDVCFCEDGEQGERTCLADGTFGFCACQDADAGADTDARSDSGDVSNDIETDAASDTSADVLGDATGDATLIDADADATESTVAVVLMTHIEDNTPSAEVGTPEARTQYARLRTSLLRMGERMQERDLQWVLQPDWKVLEFALEYDSGPMTEDTNGQNVFAYLQNDLGVRVDPHSHENRGYNYTDVAYLLDALGVGGSNVIGGHIWDPELDSFQAWDRFRSPLQGQRYPEFTWRGDILIGAGTPDHVNDPKVSGVWRPLDRDHFFDHDPNGNIVALGAWATFIDVEVEDRPTAFITQIGQLIDANASGEPGLPRVFTANINIGVTAFGRPEDLETLDANLLTPIAQLQADSELLVLDFQAVVELWDTSPGSNGSLYTGE